MELESGAFLGFFAVSISKKPVERGDIEPTCISTLSIFLINLAWCIHHSPLRVM